MAPAGELAPPPDSSRFFQLLARPGKSLHVQRQLVALVSVLIGLGAGFINIIIHRFIPVNDDKVGAVGYTVAHFSAIIHEMEGDGDVSVRRGEVVVAGFFAVDEVFNYPGRIICIVAKVQIRPDVNGKAVFLDILIAHGIHDALLRINGPIFTVESTPL